MSQTVSTAATNPEFTTADRLRKARQLSGNTTVSFAEAIGLSRQAVVRYETGNGAPAPKTTLLQWAAATGVSLSWLESGETVKATAAPLLALAIGRRLQKARQKTGMSVTQFADATHLSSDAVEAYENGQPPTDSLIRVWSKSTGIPTEWLSEGTVPIEFRAVPERHFVSLYS
jgi:transcriptional regulator with XRE-family HTH domain